MRVGEREGERGREEEPPCGCCFHYKGEETKEGHEGAISKSGVKGDGKPLRRLKQINNSMKSK